MSYTVIARRWRPQRFEDVVGQPHIITTVKNSIKYDRLAHGYLFTGPRGVGKTSFARILAKALNCLNLTMEEPCGVCENCLSVDSGTFVDIIEVDAASKTGVDDMRDLLETVRYLPMKGKYKFYILDEAHMLSKSAVSALLKTLEEPPGHNVFILATTDVQKIPPTIMSRCQRYDFRRISEAVIGDQLKKVCREEGIGFDDTVIQQIARIADGSMRDGETILDQVIAYGGTQISEKDVANVVGVVQGDVSRGIMKSVVAQDLKAGLEIIDRTLGDGYDASQVYEGLVFLVRNMMIVKIFEGKPPFLDASEDELLRYAELVENLEYYEIQNMLHYLLRADDLIRGPFPKVSLEVIYINLYNISRLRDVERMLEGMARREPRPETPKVETPVQRDQVEETKTMPWAPVVGEARLPYHTETPVLRDEKAFVEYLKRSKPFIGNVLELLKRTIEENNFVIFLDRKNSYIKDDTEQKDEIKRQLKEFFGREMTLQFRDAGETKKNLLDEYMADAETLFKL